MQTFPKKRKFLSGLQSGFPLPVIQLQPLQIIRCQLINAVINPVCKEQICTATPGIEGRFAGVVVGEIVGRNGNRQPLFLVPEIFFCQCHAVILQMSGDEILSAVGVGDNVHASLWRFGQDFQFLALVNICSPDFRVSGMRSIKAVVKSTQQLHIFLQHLVWKDPEHLSGRSYLGSPKW